MLIPTNLPDLALLILRIALGVIFIYHGFPKLKNAKGVAQAMGMSTAFVLLIGLMETLGGIGALLGIFTQVAGILIGLVMLGALKLKLFKWKVPFSAHDKMGWEFDLILLAVALALLFLGAGAYSVDAALGW